MQNVRNKIDMRQDMEHSASEESKTFAVVVTAIQVGTLKIVFVVDKIDNNAVFFEFKDSAVQLSPGKRHGDIAKERHLRTVFLAYRTV